MARRVFFSFHYKNDVWRSNTVRNSGTFEGQAAAGFYDASLWESAKAKGDDALRRLINDGLKGTSVTAVLIGAETAQRRWVNYEIDKSLERGNGLLGVYIDQLKDRDGRTARRGAVPKRLREEGAPVYEWDHQRFGAWVENAAHRAGKASVY